MKTFTAILVFFFSITHLASAKRPFHEIEGKIKSVVFNDKKVVFILSGTIHLAMFSANRNDWETPTSILDDVAIIYYRQPNSVDLEAQWQTNVAVLRDSLDKSVKFSCPAPSYVFEQDRITSFSTTILWVTKP